MRRLAPIVCLCLAACASPGELRVELGTGETGFEPIDGEPTLPLVAGPQGGHHVWISLRVDGASSDQVQLLVDGGRLDDPSPPPRREPIRVHLTPMPEGDAVLIGWPAELVDPGCLVGERVVLRATIVDPDGLAASGERVVVVGAGTNAPGCE